LITGGKLLAIFYFPIASAISADSNGAIRFLIVYIADNHVRQSAVVKQRPGAAAIFGLPNAEVGAGV
jgi:hypothetical protein